MSMLEGGSFLKITHTQIVRILISSTPIFSLLSINIENFAQDLMPRHLCPPLLNQPRKLSLLPKLIFSIKQGFGHIHGENPPTHFWTGSDLEHSLFVCRKFQKSNEVDDAILYKSMFFPEGFMGCFCVSLGDFVQVILSCVSMCEFL